MDKSSLKKALLEAKEIENFATESAKKIIEKEFLPKIENTVKQTLMEMEEKEMEENSEVSLDAGSSVNVKVSNDGTITIKTDDTTNTPVLNQRPLTSDDIEVTEIGDEETEEEIGVDTEEEAEEEELFEIVEELNEEEDSEKIKDVEDKINSLESKIDKILELVGGEKAEGEVEIVDDEETEETPVEEPAKEETPETEEEPAKEEAPVEEPTKKEETKEEAPETEEEASEEEELVFEFDDVLDEEKNKDLQEIKSMLKELEELELQEEEEDEEEIDITEEMLEEILKEYGDENEMTFSDALELDEEEEMCEIEIDENEEEEMEEGAGISLTNRQGQNLKPNTPHKKVRTGLSESIKAQYESKLDGLKKENESLKTALKEYKDSFVVLRKQINEVQTFNAKLAYANKVFTKGGLTNEEKTRISEQFDVCKTAEEAKALYNKLIKEGVSSVKTTVDKIKLPKAANTSNSKGVIYESEETKRMKKLAGII
jgi:hypothetical protein